jgi:hypothetical protein
VLYQLSYGHQKRAASIAHKKPNARSSAIASKHGAASRCYGPRMRLVWVFSVLGACSDEAPLEGVPLEEYCSVYAEAACSAGMRCGCGAAIADYDAMCTARAEAACPMRDGASARAMIDSGAIAYDALSARRFLDSLDENACNTPRLACSSQPCALVSDVGGPCGMFVGCTAGSICFAGACRAPLADGVACTDSLECGSGRCQTTCVAKAPLGTGCATDPECESGRCDFAVGRCAAPQPEGELCADAFDCASGYCERPDELAAGMCRPRRADGEDCARDASCASGFCLSNTCTSSLCLP